MRKIFAHQKMREEEREEQMREAGTSLKGLGSVWGWRLSGKGYVREGWRTAAGVGGTETERGEGSRVERACFLFEQLH